MLQLQRASAGSGKTEQLARRYLQIFLEPDHSNLDPATVVATTFTREAAGEILARIFRLLAKACEEEAIRKKLVEGTSLPIPNRETCARLLRKLIDQVHRLSIGTIDALFAQQARVLVFDLGMASPWEIADFLMSQELAREALLRLLKKEPKIREAWSLLHHGTRQLSFVERGVQLFEKNRWVAHVEPFHQNLQVAPPQIFPAAAAEKVRTFLKTFQVPLNGKGKPDGRWVKALQKMNEFFGQPLLLKDVLRGGTLLTNCLEAEPAFFSVPIPDVFLTLFLPLLQQALEECRRLEALRETILWRMIQQYEKLRKENSFRSGRYTFSEVEEAVQMGQHHLSLEEIALRMDLRTEHLLLDEYQDTSRCQHDVLSPLVGNVLAKGGNVFVVGDVKQGIYGWRGGKRHLLSLLEQEHHIFQKEIPPLNQSYRSSRAVLESVNEVFGALTHHDAVMKMEGGAAFAKVAARWSVDFQPHVGAPSVANLRGRVRVHLVAAANCYVAPVLASSNTSCIPRVCTPSTPRSSLPSVILKTDSNIDAETQDPMRGVLERAVELVKQHLQDDPLREVAILVRRTKFISQLLQLLGEYEIVASGEGGNPLTDTLAVELLLSLLNWIDHPGHTAAYDHVFHSPLRDLVDRKDAALQLRKKLLDAGYATTLRSWTAISGFQRACSPYERGRVEQLIALAETFDAAGGGGPSLFIKRVRNERVESPLPARVRVLTIHAAKGLEFESVILMDLDVDITAGGEHGLRLQQDEEGHFFIQGSQETMALQGRNALLTALNEEQWAEMLSLLYVGMTRAACYLDLLIFEKPFRKKTMAQWLRASGLQSHEVEGKAWRLVKGIQGEHAPSELRIPPHWPSVMKYQKLSQRHPSEEQEGRVVSLGQLLRGQAARLRGTTFHAQLAQVEWSSDLESLISPTPPASVVWREKEVFQKEFFLERWRKWGVTRLELWRERRFAVPHKVKGELLVGVFDRVVIGENASGIPIVAEIIDFKTGNQEEQTKKEALYQPQLKAYCVALQHLLPMLKEITTRLVWIDS